MTILTAIENALLLLESLGYRSGDVHDDLQEAARTLRKEALPVARQEIAITNDGNDQLEVLVDGKWHTPYKINDQRQKQGWVGYRLMDGRVGVAIGEQVRFAVESLRA